MSVSRNEDRTRMSRMADINLIISAMIQQRRPARPKEGRADRERLDRSIYI